MKRLGFNKNKTKESLKLTSIRSKISISEFLIFITWLIGSAFLISFNLKEEMGTYVLIVNSISIIALIISLLVIVNEVISIYEIELFKNSIIIRKKGIFKSKSYDLNKKLIKKIYLKRIGFPRFFEDIPLYTIIRSALTFWTLQIPAINIGIESNEILLCNNMSRKNRKWIVKQLNYYLET